MTPQIVDYRKIIQIVVPLAAALLVLSSFGHAPAQAQGTHMLVIPASDGYGFDDCVGSSKACGQVIADAWCEAHGMAASVSFGRAEDITASMPKPVTDAKIASLAPASIVVNCRD